MSGLENYEDLVDLDNFDKITITDVSEVHCAVLGVLFNKNLALVSKGLYALLIFLDDIDRLKITNTSEYSSNGQTSISRAWKELKKFNIVSRKINRVDNTNIWTTELRIPPKELLNEHLLSKISKNSPLDEINSGEIESDKEIHEVVKKVILSPRLSLQAKGLYAMLVFIDDINKLSVTTTKDYVSDGQTAVNRPWYELDQAKLVTRRMKREVNESAVWSTHLLSPNFDELANFCYDNDKKSMRKRK
ncbi:hypothetical protein P7D73_18090 [Enterococcus raffinosus]|uniref:hypothetical protein n=1 Tax=Enterococcus raffinosus TaxID=71452 RepID=UPI00288F2B7D|nr:hypothetical protein [Enterococcus raffinosus]MDT2525117.1 hypothetical protein [Enterococcus raffinosus]MDT2592472.1 hypothetical protein [Enterococcus raffinosus]